MKTNIQQPFFFKAGPRAVLLLHGFTGSSADVRMLGRFLEKNGYTSYAPHYRGHGVAPEELIKTNPSQWWADVVAAYDELRDQGYEEIAVCGLSLGGVMSLKLALNKPVKGIVTMCAPMTMRTTDVMFEGVLKYAAEYKKYEQKDNTTIEQEVAAIRAAGMPSLAQLREFVYDVRAQVDELYTPLFVVQARHDEIIDPNSANIIFDAAESTEKQLNWYEEAGHVITLSNEKTQLHHDIEQFLNSLDWQ
ncbi:MAG: carboxylesterase [Caryophanon sp.]|nr:carboxylesterase [Caryophanon sp.]